MARTLAGLAARLAAGTPAPEQPAGLAAALDAIHTGPKRATGPHTLDAVLDSLFAPPAPDLAQRLSARLGDAPVIPTGAGHDAGVLALAGVPTAMLFVRNPTGVSHSPAEHAEMDDCLAGVDALTEVVEELTGGDW